MESAVGLLAPLRRRNRIGRDSSEPRGPLLSPAPVPERTGAPSRGPSAMPLTSRFLSPRPKHELAREHLDRGLSGVTASDAAEAVAWLFLSLEAAIVSVAEKHGLDTQKQHWKKAEVAKELHTRGVLPHDYSDLLGLLNEARKAATYEGDEPDLEGQSLEDIAAEVEAAVKLAEQESK
jgi:hypothetical protein